MENNEPTRPQPKISELAKALAKAQGEFPVIPKDSEVEVKSKEGKTLYKYKYADLTTIISATRPAMSKAGLSFTQGVVPGGFVTTIMHESGEELVTGFIPCSVPTNADMKQVAGLITYVKRISLTAALGVSADEDVDAAGNEAVSGNTTKKTETTKTPPKQVPPSGLISPAQITRLHTIAKKQGWLEDDYHHALQFKFKIKSSKECTTNIYNDVVKYFETNKPEGINP